MNRWPLACAVIVMLVTSGCTSRPQTSTPAPSAATPTPRAAEPSPAPPPAAEASPVPAAPSPAAVGSPQSKVNAVLAKGITETNEPKEVATGYIEGSVLIPVNDVLGRAKELSTEASLLFVCAEGARSALACEMAAAVGRREVFNLEGGMKEWVRRGYPVVIP